MVLAKQTNFTSGVVDPLLIDREDTVFYFNGLEDGENLMVIPQGGAKRRPGKRLVQELSKVLSLIDLSGATVTAPNGGTASNAYDGDDTTLVTMTSNIGTTNPCVVLHIDFGSNQAVDAVDIVNYSLTGGSLDDEFFVQYSDDDASWSNYGPAFNWTDTARSRRRRIGQTVTHRYWRIVRIGATSIAEKANIGEVRFFEETSELSNAKFISFAYSTVESYMMVVSDKNADVLKGDVLAGSVYLPHENDDIDILNWSQTLDTLLLYHPDHQPNRIFRQGSDDEFDYRKQDFANIPKYDYGAGTGGVNEVQSLNDGGTLASGDKFTILLEGIRTTTITGGATRADSAAAIQTALRALSNTSSSGITVSNTTDGFTVTFAGDDGDQPWIEMDVGVMSGNSVWTVSRITKGEYPGEDVMSDTRGWPRCGTFYQGRHHIGGLKGLPDAILSSALLGDNGLSKFFNFEITIDDDNRALFNTADTDQVSTIYQMYPGRHLSIFTSDSEFFIPNEPISVESVLKQTTRAGSKEGIRVHEADGALLFLQGVQDDNSTLEIGTSLREFLFIDTEQSYQAQNLSRLSSHLIKDPISVSLRKAVDTDEADMLLLVNNDGTLTANTVMRLENVNAFMPMSTGNDVRTNDKILACGVDKKRRVYFLTERDIAGTTKRFIERWDDNMLLDCSGVVSVTSETYIATEGQTTFNWTFTNPASADAIGVRVNGGRLDPSEYSVTLGSKQIVLDTAAVVGDQVRIASMIDEISDLDIYEGEDLQVLFDGTPEPDVFTVSSGVLSLGKYADTEIQYGFDFNVYGKLLPFRIPETETLDGQLMRVVNVFLSLYNTGDIDLRANDGDWQPVSLLSYDEDILDRSMMELLFTGTKEVEGLLGYTKTGNVEFRQSTFAPLTLRSITREVVI